MKDENELESNINNALDSSVDNLSPDIRRNLNRIRIEAVENRKKPLVRWKYASALSIVFAVVIGFQLVPTIDDAESNLFAEVLQEDLEMIDELEFVYWMAESEIEEVL